MKNMTKKNYKKGALVLATAVSIANVTPSVVQATTISNVTRQATSTNSYITNRLSDSTYEIKSSSSNGTVNYVKELSISGYSYFNLESVFEIDSSYVVAFGYVSNDGGVTKEGIMVRLDLDLTVNSTVFIPLSLSSNSKDSSISNVSITSTNHANISGPSLSSLTVMLPGVVSSAPKIEDATIDGRVFTVIKDRGALNYSITENIDGLDVFRAGIVSDEDPRCFVIGDNIYLGAISSYTASLTKYTISGESVVIDVSNEDNASVQYVSLIDSDQGHVFVSTLCLDGSTNVTYLTEYDSDLNYVACYKFDSGNDWEIPTISSVSVTDKTLVLVLDGEVVEIDRKGLPSDDEVTTTPPVDSGETPDEEESEDSTGDDSEDGSTGDDSNPVVPPSDDSTEGSTGDDSIVPPTGGDSTEGDDSSNGGTIDGDSSEGEDSSTDDSEETETSRTIYTFVDDSENVYTVVVNNQTGEYSLIRKTADGTERVIYDFPVGYIAGFKFIDGELYYVGAGDSGYKVSRYVLEDESVSSTALGTDGIVDNFNVFTSDGSVFVAYSLFATRATEDDAKIFVAELNQSDLSLLTTYGLAEPSNVGFIKNITADSNEVYIDYAFNGEDKTLSFQRVGADEDVPTEDEGTQTPPVENPGEDEGTQTPPTEDGDEVTGDDEVVDEETPGDDEVVDEETPGEEEGDSTEEETPSDDESDKEESDKTESEDKEESDKEDSDKTESEDKEDSVKVESTESDKTESTNSSNSTESTTTNKLPQTGSVASALTAVTGLVSSALGFVLTRKKND